MKQKNIRNFSIIAHIDHGKSTLADRMLENSGAVSNREGKEQILDSMDLERERGITIKLNTASMHYSYLGEDYLLNLIDTPGHVDFSYEVSRSLAASDGALLVVDATQGVEAQTLSNLYLAMEHDLELIPVINKIDLANADVSKVKEELKKLVGFDDEEFILTSAKTGVGIDELMEEIIVKIPPPVGDSKKPLEALIFDSVFDQFRGVIISIRLFSGTLHVGDTIIMHESSKEYVVSELFITTPLEKKVSSLSVGEVGHVVASIKDISTVHVGDTLTSKEHYSDQVLAGYQPMKPMVFCGMYPVESVKFEPLRDAFHKLKLNDASFVFTPESSQALGFGFRCGFLGLLHMDIIKERISREFGIDLITTAPTVVYQVFTTKGECLSVSTPSLMPDAGLIKEIREPFIKTNIFTPSAYIGPIMELCQNRRGHYLGMEYLDESRVNLHYELPLAEIIYDFFDHLKSATKGYASFDYEMIGEKRSDLVKMDILLNGEKVDALSVIVPKEFAYIRGKRVVLNLKKSIPRQLFEIPIQAVLGSRVVARSTVKALRKDVLAKCYGGDVSRKKKLLEKQKAGKKKMRKLGSVELPPDAFMSVLNLDEEHHE